MRVRLWSGAILLIVLTGAVVAFRPTAPPAEPPDSARGQAAGLALGLQQASRLGESTAPTVTETEAPTTTGTTLPLPDPPPRDPYAPTPVVPLATITIPAINVRTTMYEGITLPIIDLGAGHWPGTPKPGELGNMVVAGHRTLRTHPFGDLDKLVPGDKVIFDVVGGGRFVYEVRGTIIVPANNIGLASQSAAHTATLFACHPKGQAIQRIATKLRLLGPDGKPADAEADLPSMDVGNRSTDNTLFVRQNDDQSGGGGGGDPFAGSGQ